MSEIIFPEVRAKIKQQIVEFLGMDFIRERFFPGHMEVEFSLMDLDDFFFDIDYDWIMEVMIKIGKVRMLVPNKVPDSVLVTIIPNDLVDVEGPGFKFIRNVSISGTLLNSMFLIAGDFLTVYNEYLKNTTNGRN